MKIVVSRFKDGRIKITKEYEKEDSNFRESDSSECLRYDQKELEIEALLMGDHWNKEHHGEFEHKWQELKNITNRDNVNSKLILNPRGMQSEEKDLDM